jgi:hypothetical protein
MNNNDYNIELLMVMKKYLIFLPVLLPFKWGSAFDGAKVVE